MLADINGIVAGPFTLSAPKKARTNDAMKSMHEHVLKILVTIRIAVDVQCDVTVSLRRY